MLYIVFLINSAMITVVGNLKGGTGKSTLVFNLAIWLLHKRTRVEVYDLDPQATLSDVAELRSEEGFRPFLSVTGFLPEKSFEQSETLIDIGVSNMGGLYAALARADRIIIPVSPSQADVWSTQRFLHVIRKASKKAQTLYAFINRADTHPAALENAETESALRQLGGLEVLSVRLAQRVIFRRSFSEGLAVFELEPSGKASQELMALAEAVYGAESY